MVTVHEAKGLPGGDLPDPPDPYVKMYLLPSRNKKSKRKTEAQKDTVTPIYNEDFDYEMTASKMASEQLEVSVVDRKGIFSRGSTMGRTVIDLDQIVSREVSKTWWADFSAADRSADFLADPNSGLIRHAKFMLCSSGGSFLEIIFERFYGHWGGFIVIINHFKQNMLRTKESTVN